MNEHLVQTIDMLVADVSAKEKEMADLKRTINYLCEKAQIPVKYQQIDMGQQDAAPVSMTISPDRYHGKPLNRAVTDYLKMRAAVNSNARNASAEEIYEALIRGGYTFEQKAKDEQMHSLKVSLGKSTHTFRKLPTGLYGLVEWYDSEPRPRRARKAAQGDSESNASKPNDSDSRVESDENDGDSDESKGGDES